MAARRLDPGRLLAALNAQRAALAYPPWAGAETVAALGPACVQAVLVALDRGASPTRDAAASAVRYTLELLTARAPGRAVEVRVPPYAAVQCISGQRHTRGTPPNVVETDAVTWIQLAAGRMRWPDAVRDGRVSVSGQRADLAGYLPVITLAG